MCFKQDGAVKQYPDDGSFCPSSDVDPVVNPHTGTCGHLKKKNKGWKEETNTNLEKQKSGGEA